MIKWPINNKHTEQHKNTKTRKTPRRNIHSETQYCLCFSDFSFSFIYNFLNDFSKKCKIKKKGMKKREF